MSKCIAMMYGHSCARQDGHGRDHAAANGYAWTQPERDGYPFVFHNGEGTRADYDWHAPT